MANTETGIAEELLRRLAAAMRAAQLYSTQHPIIARNVQALSTVIARLHRSRPVTTVGIVGGTVVVDDVPIRDADALGDIFRRLHAAGIERMSIEQGVDDDELAALVHAVATVEPRGRSDQSGPELPSFAHVRLGRIETEARSGESPADMATIRRLYSDAVTVAEDVWQSAMTEHKPDAGAARAMIDSLAQAVAQNRTALLALTALQKYDNYTFTHMVNVAILTMGQARGMGIEGSLLREFGLAALMHDIGKVRTPMEILNKPDSLTADEFLIMKRHPLDGAEMLRDTPEMPSLAPVVAFEHHLRIDGTGYPNGVARSSLNLCTMLCSVADVYDAMRSQRRYQESFATDRILQVMQRDDGQQFDRHLVRRFVQLLGVYPAGNLVRLDTGEVAVVVRTFAPDPHRPHVRVLFDRAGTRLERSRDIRLWEHTHDAEGAPAIRGPVNPADYGIDPLTFL
jgi:putative nucleotidyltransferase with HDIG domain